MAYYRKPSFGMDDVHHLLGVTLRDSQQNRCGRIVGLDYTHEQPIIDLLWEGQKKVDRIEVTQDMLASLMKAFFDVRRASTVRAVDSTVEPAVARDIAATSQPEEKEQAAAIDATSPQRRRA